MVVWWYMVWPVSITISHSHTIIIMHGIMIKIVTGTSYLMMT